MIRLGVIGLGRWGQNIMRTLSEIPDCTVTHQATTDYAALVDAPLDGVLIATPGSTHAAIAKPFLEKGLAVFIEKPLTTSLKDAEELAEIATKSGSIAIVGHVHLYNPAFLKTKELATQAGKIRLLHFEGTNNGPYRDDMSALWDWAPHDISMAVDLLQEMPTHVQAWGVKTLRPATELYDTAILKLTFASGIIAFCQLSWLFPEKRKKLTLIAEKSSIIFDDTAEKKIKLFENMGPEVIENTIHIQQPQISYPEYSLEAPLKLEMQAFLKAIKTKQQPLTSLSQGLEVVRIIELAQQSIELDGRIVNC